MRSTLPIGNFARATHLSIKTLHHYHRVGLLEPADVDPATGHRRYTTDQIPTAQVIRRFRSLDMPLDEIRAVIIAPDLTTRNEIIVAHLERLEGSLARTEEAVASLRSLLQLTKAATPATFEHRSVLATSAAAIRQVIDIDDVALWFEGALGELHATLPAQNIPARGRGGGIYANDPFAHERGEATVYLPCDTSLRSTGRIEPLVVPEIELAIAVHIGPHTDMDRTYGALATYVADHALAVEGPIREYYLVGSHDTA